MDNKIDELRSPISKCMGISGECFCGAFASKGEKTEIKIFSPTTFDKINMIREWLLANTDMEWDWDESPPKGRAMEKLGQQNLFSPQMIMCSTCMNNTDALND
jgi:hypothetical protein